MSSAEGAKKRKVQHACVMCRRRKVQCDGDKNTEKKCSTCVANNFDCTWAERAKRGKRRSRVTKAYVESLESRLEQMERLLANVYPGGITSQELDIHTDHGNAPETHITSVSPRPIVTRKAMIGPAALRSDDPTSPSNGPESSDEEVDTFNLKLSDSLRNMTLNPGHHRFFGKSSGLAFVQQAIDLKTEHTGEQRHNMRDIFYRRRSEFLNRYLEDIPNQPDDPPFTFPEPDLARQLIDLYFTYTNSVSPLLHQPTFERKYADGLHIRDPAFGAVLLLVCAVAAPWCEDSRVLLPGSGAEHHAGWQWFEQVQSVKKTLLGPPCLEDLQMHCLSSLYLQGTSSPQACWTVVGIGIRLAQDVGAHRRKVYNTRLTVEDELWKRAFWVLVTLDRTLSAGWGRPCAIHDEDFDVDLPVVCDDEYWEHSDPEQAFTQPPEHPSTAAFFIAFIKLTQILAFALRTIYSINKSKMSLGFVGQKWEQRIVSELDSALNEWFDSLPDHLRWDPNIQDPIFRLQSCTLYASYSFTQIIIHGPFIPSPRKPSSLPIPSLAICTSAARLCCHVIDEYMQKAVASSSVSMLPLWIQRTTSMAGIMLLLNSWSGRQSGLLTDAEKNMDDFRKCLAALKQWKKRFYSAGRFDVLLGDLASLDNFPVPKARTSGTAERTRDGGVPHAPLVSSSDTGAPTERDDLHDFSGMSRFQALGHVVGPGRDMRGDPLQSQSQIQWQDLPQPSSIFTQVFGGLDIPEMSFGPWTSEFEYPPIINQRTSSTYPSGDGDMTTDTSLPGAGTGAAPHVPFGMDDFLYRLMSGDTGVGSGEAGAEMNDRMNYLDNVHSGDETHSAPGTDTMSTWSNAPQRIQTDDWGLHISSMFVENDSDAHDRDTPGPDPCA